MKMTHRNPTPLTLQQIQTLEAQGCFSSEWERVRIAPGSDLSLIRNVEFEGDVEIGLLDSSRYPGCRISNALIADSIIGAGARIRNVHGGIRNAVIGSGVTIENVSRITFDSHPLCGIGSRVGVLDESGAREVIIYPGLSAQSAMLMARARRSDAENIYSQTLEFIDSLDFKPHIGDNVRILDCGTLHNVSVDHDVTVSGATRLCNGSIINNAPAGESIAAVGAAVDADSFILEDAALDSGAIVRNCLIGQGVRLEKGFTAHDSLFFANSTLENGEACALFAGPYTVSMHKGTLLIGCQTSFLNAGSSTNQSNHMYKLGPVHWGVLERGVKTSSGSYLMLGANIGAFSLLMGQHKTHPDSTEFPFSYLFGDEKGATVVVPAVMLRSCGLLRDEQKWPARDRRTSLPKLNDRVIFDILNPVTVSAMMNALATIRPMLTRPADDDRYIRYKGMKLSRASLERALKFYGLAILKYFAKVFFPETQDADGEPTDERRIAEWAFPSPPADEDERTRDAGDWIDLAGQPMPRRILQQALEAESVEQREDIFNDALENYRAMQMKWIAARTPSELRMHASEILLGARKFDNLVEIDRETYRSSLSAENSMLTL